MQRLVKQYKFEPSIAEVLDVWHTIKREKRRTSTTVLMPNETRASARQLQGLKRAKESLQDRTKTQDIEVSKELIDFARSFFPDISMTTIEKNRLEIANCMWDRRKDLQEKNGYMTYMKLDKHGVITLYIASVK